MTATMYSVTVLLNGTSRFAPYSEGDALAYDARTVLSISTTSVDAALGLAFAIGNREGRDSLARLWSSDIRSVSVGDVIQIATVSGVRVHSHAYYAVEPVGFRLLDGMPGNVAFGDAHLIELGVARPA